jgi:hypothetical protein
MIFHSSFTHHEPPAMTKRKRILVVKLIFIIGIHLTATLVPVESTADNAHENESFAHDPLIPLRYEAEDAYNSHSVSNSTTENGVTYMDFQERGAFVQWQIPVPTSGGYEVAVRYFSDYLDRPAELQVSSKVIAYEMPQNPGWAETWRTEKHSFELAGSPRPTTFRLIALGSTGPLIDYIEIRKQYHLLGYNNQKPYDGNQWHIQRIDAPPGVVAFQGADENHGSHNILIQYEVYKAIELDQVKVQIFASNCFSRASAGILATETVIVSNLLASDPDLRILQVYVDIDPQNLYGSNIWTSSQAANHTRGTILFCARVDLISYAFDPPESESFLESIVAQHVELSASFSLAEPIGAIQIVDRVFEAEEDAIIRYPISVCPCTADYKCIPNPVTVHINSNLHLCLHADSTNVEVRHVVDMSLRQDNPDGGSLMYHAIEDSEPRNRLTRVSIIRDDAHTGNVASVKTRLLTAFFGEEGSPEREIIVRGRVALGFLDPTRREFRGLRSSQLLDDTYSSEVMVDESFQTTIEIVPDGRNTDGAEMRPTAHGLWEVSLICLCMVLVLQE